MLPSILDLHLLIFGLEIILAFILVLWLRYMGRGEPAPWGFLFKLLFFGSLTAILAGYVEIRYSFIISPVSANPVLLENLNNGAASLTEELAKYFAATFTIINTRHFHKLSDAILYMIIIGLGFSLVEDAFFLISPQTDAPYRLLSFYLHSGTSAIIGYHLGRFKYKLDGYPQLMLGVFYAVLLHFSYNWATSLQRGDLGFYLTVSITLYISLQIFILYRRAIIEEFKLDHKKTARPRVKLLNLE